MVRPERFELPTFWFVAATVRIGEGDGSITLDDMRELTKNFDQIAAGATVVE